MGVEFGLLIPTREAVMSGRPETAPLLALADRAEAAGFHAVWIGDSLTARPRHEPLTLMAAIAGRTRRVKLGTAVLLPALRPPVVLAHIVGTLDRAAEGRVILGVGIAADNPAIRREFAAAGVPWERRVGRFLETLEICRARGHAMRELRGQALRSRTSRWSPSPGTRAGARLWIGGTGLTSLREWRAGMRSPPGQADFFAEFPRSSRGAPPVGPPARWPAQRAVTIALDAKPSPLAAPGASSGYPPRPCARSCPPGDVRQSHRRLRQWLQRWIGPAVAPGPVRRRRPDGTREAATKLLPRLASR
jgi:hypothetical protein